MVVTEWNESLDLGTLKERMRSDVLVDLRNIYLPAQARAAGFRYTGIGQRKSSKTKETNRSETIVKARTLDPV